jgi:Ca-activated chloride channel family protein
VAAGILLLVIVAFLLSRPPSPDPAIAPSATTLPPTVTTAPAATASPVSGPEPTVTLMVGVQPSGTPATSPPPSSLYVEYIVDASNSMMQTLGGSQSKLEIVRSALAQHWAGLQPQPNLGLRAFGHRRSAVDPSSCLDTEQLAPVAPGQADHLVSLVNALQAQGMSPLGRTMVESTGDFTLTATRANAMILIADGADNCGDDPCQAVKTHREVGILYPIYVAGLAVDEASRGELACLAQVSGGLYRDAASERELLQILDEFVREIGITVPR